MCVSAKTGYIFGAFDRIMNYGGDCRRLHSTSTTTTTSTSTSTSSSRRLTLVRAGSGCCSCATRRRPSSAPSAACPSTRRKCGPTCSRCPRHAPLATRFRSHYSFQIRHLTQYFERKQKQEEKLRLQKDIESHRQAAQLYLARIRETIAKKFRQAAHEKQFADVVIEREVPGLGCDCHCLDS